MDHIAAIYIEIIQPMTLNVSLMYKVNLISFINYYLHQILKLIVDRSYFTDLSYSTQRYSRISCEWIDRHNH